MLLENRVRNSHGTMEDHLSRTAVGFLNVVSGQAVGAVMEMQAHIQAGQFVGKRRDHADIVRDQHHGDSGFRFPVSNPLQEQVLTFGVHSHRGFVEQQEFGLVDQGAGDEDALLLATGEFPRGRSA